MFEKNKYLKQFVFLKQFILNCAQILILTRKKNPTMRRKLGQIKKEVKHYLLFQLNQIYNWFLDVWVKAALIVAFGMLLYKKDVNFQFGINGFQIASFSAFNSQLGNQEFGTTSDAKTISYNTLVNDLPKAVFANFDNKGEKVSEPRPQKPTWTDNQNLANSYSNMTYSVGDFATKETTSQFKTKRVKQLAYIKRFAHVAQSEMDKYGIPASITLAQGLLESNVGESRLSVKNNNHFGMKCFSKSCKKGHCSNFTDDSHKDFFRKYQTAWESYRAHSLMLRGKRYRHLLKLPKTDYKGWARGLKKAGYATDKRYAEKLINLIEDLSLQEYDRK